MTKGQPASHFPPKLSQPAQRALANAGYSELAQLSAVTAAELGQLHGMGPKALAQLQEALRARGLGFAPQTGYAPVNGLKMYYEIHKDIHSENNNDTLPLVLLHGGLGLGEMFSPILPHLQQGRRVIVADLHAHGRTAAIERPLRAESMADDVAALIQHLDLEHVHLMGYSMGGAVALRVAIQYPEIVERLVLVSTPYKHDGWYPEIIAQMRQMGAAAAPFLQGTPMHESYMRVAPKVEDFPLLLDKMGDMVRQEYNWSAEVEKLTLPVMLVYGDADSVPPGHAAEFFARLCGGLQDGGWDGSGMSTAQLAILPATTHYNIFSSPVLASTVIPFLDAQTAPHPGVL